MQNQEMERGMEILRVENLTRKYGKGDNEVVAVNNMSFSVEKGEIGRNRW